MLRRFSLLAFLSLVFVLPAQAKTNPLVKAFGKPTTVGYQSAEGHGYYCVYWAWDQAGHKLAAGSSAVKAHIVEVCEINKKVGVLVS